MLKMSIQADDFEAVSFPTRFQYSCSVYGKVKLREKKTADCYVLFSSVALKQEKEMAIISLFYRIVLSMINEFIRAA